MRPVQPAEHVSLLGQRRAELGAVVAGFIGSDARIVWEVGSGHGHFLTAYARAHPAEVCVGVDIMSDRVNRAQRKRDRAQLANLHFVRADAGDFLAVLPADARFASVFVLFPDPWPKRRHHKNRVMTEGFLSAVAARCDPGAQLNFRTDYAPYFQVAAALLRAHADWAEVDPAHWPFEEATVFQKRAPTHFSLVARRR
jgi:tRNA (guanine-N7-)-methyltransferase